MGLMLEGKSFPVLGVGGGTLTLGGLWTRKSNSNENSCDLISSAGEKRHGIVGKGGFKKHRRQYLRTTEPHVFLLSSPLFSLVFFWHTCVPFHFFLWRSPPPFLSVCIWFGHPVRQGIAVTPGNKALDLGLWSRKLARGQGWKIYTRLHNITYLYLRWTLEEAWQLWANRAGGREFVCY